MNRLDHQNSWGRIGRHRLPLIMVAGAAACFVLLAAARSQSAPLPQGTAAPAAPVQTAQKPQVIDADAPTSLLITCAPKGAQIYMDDVLKGEADNKGWLYIWHVTPGKHVLRVVSEDRKEQVAKLELDEGEHLMYKLPTPSQEPPPVLPSGPKPLVATPGVALFYGSLGDNAQLTMQVHSGDSPELCIDVNGDGEIDKGGTVYAVGRDGLPCTQYLVKRFLSTPCGTFHSRATVQVEPGGALTRYVWTIPKSELSRDGKFVQLTIGVFSRRRGWAYYPWQPFIDPFKIPLQ